MIRALLAWHDFNLSLLGWRSFYRLEGMGEATLVYAHPFFGEVIYRAPAPKPLCGWRKA